MNALTQNATETQELAVSLARLLNIGDLLVLLGDLGAGKTCFTQGLARGLEIEDRVTSPTFTLVNQYRGRLVLNHLDVYRLGGAAESLDLDIYEMAEQGVTVIEWGHNISGVLAESRLEIELTYLDDISEESHESRNISLTMIGDEWNDRSDKLKTVLEPWWQND